MTMRHALLLACSLGFAVASAAQQQGPPAHLQMRMRMESLERELQALTKGISRDAFIVTQMALAAGDLRDFQKLAAIEKAIDRINQAGLRAGEAPPASAETSLAISRVGDELRRGRDQGTMADVEALQRVLLRESRNVQWELYQQLRAGREAHRVIVELEGKLQQLGTDLQSAMVEALGSNLELARAGGR